MGVTAAILHRFLFRYVCGHVSSHWKGDCVGGCVPERGCGLRRRDPRRGGSVPEAGSFTTILSFLIQAPAVRLILRDHRPDSRWRLIRGMHHPGWEPPWAGYSGFIEDRFAILYSSGKILPAFKLVCSVFCTAMAEEGDDSDGGMGILMHTCTEAWRDLINVGSPSQQDEMKKARKNKVI